MSKKRYFVKNKDGEIINTIIATPEFMAEKYKFFEECPARPKIAQLHKNARAWRDNELANTDWVVAATDHPDYDLYITYRQALRDWPATESFPDERPVLRPVIEGEVEDVSPE